MVEPTLVRYRVSRKSCYNRVQGDFTLKTKSEMWNKKSLHVALSSRKSSLEICQAYLDLAKYWLGMNKQPTLSYYTC